MSSDPHRQGQQLPPPPWASSSSSQPHPSQYPVHPSQVPYQYPPHPPHPDSMAAIQPPHHMAHHPQQDPYHLPPPPGGPYRQSDVYPPPPPAPPVVYQAAAPRQRTAIACRYCRRRKDGRCSNCVRFNQDCMFTPVSSQTQAFVPAHAAYPHLRQAAGHGPPRLGEGVTLYGPHGQPLPQQAPPPPPPQHPSEHTLPPPTGLYSQHQHQPPYHAPSHGDDRSAPLAHPSLGPDRRLQDHRGPESRYDYPSHPAPTLPPVSTATSGAPGYQSHSTPSPSTPHHYYPPSQPDRRLSSHSSPYAYDPVTTSAPSAPSAPFQTLHPPPHPRSESGPTPPPGQGPGRSGLSVREMLGPPAETPSTRSSTDSDMLNALNRRGLKQ